MMCFCCGLQATITAAARDTMNLAKAAAPVEVTATVGAAVADQVKNEAAPPRQSVPLGQSCDVEAACCSSPHAGVSGIVLFFACC